MRFPFLRLWVFLPTATVLTALIEPVETFACSGPGAALAIRTAELHGVFLLGLSAVIVASASALLVRSSTGLRAAYLLALLLPHPGWWMSATRGDCGSALQFWSLVMTLLVGLAAGLAICWPRPSGERSSKTRWMLSGALIGMIAGLLACCLLGNMGSDSVTTIVLLVWTPLSLTMAGTLLGADFHRLRPSPWYRPRFRLRTLFLLPIVLAPLLICLFPVVPYEQSFTVTSTYHFLIVDEKTRQPIAGASVRLIDLKFDPDNTEMQRKSVVTGADGLAEYYVEGYSYGRRGLLGQTETITYNPLLIRVDAPGYQSFLTSLAPDPSMSTRDFTAPPLGLSFPPPATVTIGLKKSASARPWSKAGFLRGD